MNTSKLCNRLNPMFSPKLPQRNLLLLHPLVGRYGSVKLQLRCTVPTISFVNTSNSEMAEVSEQSRCAKQNASGQRIINVGPCRMKFIAEQEHSVEELPAPHENPRLMPLRDSSHLVQKEDSREDSTAAPDWSDLMNCYLCLFKKIILGIWKFVQ